jgi:glutamate formiminotransferase
MRKHSGNHPRIGSLDVCPIVPIYPSTIDDANECIQNILKEIEFHKIKVGGWLYSESSVSSENYELSNVRKGQYEMLAKSRKKFDFGYFNPRFGAMALGARNFLIAYNINLGKNKVFEAKKIAGIIRESSPVGISGVKSIGWYCDNLSYSQVSCNIVDIETCTLKMIYDRVLFEAENIGIKTYGSELIGMLPKIGFRDFNTSRQAVEYLKLNSINPIEIEKRIIENYI